MTPRQTYTRFAAILNKLEQKYIPVFQTIFTKQAAAFNTYAAQHGYEQAQNKLIDFFPAEPLIQPMIDMHKQAAATYGNITYRELRGAKGQVVVNGAVHVNGAGMLTKKPGGSVRQLFNVPTEIGNRITVALRMSLLQNVHGISDTVKENTLSIIQEGNLNGWGYDKIAAKIQDQIGSKWRALRIVSTESVKAANMGAIEGARLTGFEMLKRWVSAHDNRVRGNPAGKYPESEYDHWDMDSVTLPLDQPFHLGSRTTGVASDILQFPGDPNGAAGNIIACRCTLSFIVKRDVRNRPIRVQQNAIAA
jgi:hypothetical protein